MKPLILDEMFSPRIAEELRAAGVDVHGVCESSALRGIADADLLEVSSAQGRILVTENIADFVVLARRWTDEGGELPGILFVSAKAFPQGRVRTGRIVAALKARPREDRRPGLGTVDFV